MNELASLSVAEKRSLIAKLTAEVSGSRSRRKRSETPVYLTDDEISAFFRAIDKEAKRNGSRSDAIRDRALFEIALGRGLRASEVGKLEMAHLRMKDNRLFVTRLKGGRTGEFLITERESRALKPYLRDRGGLPGPLFPSRNKRPISRRRLDELHKQYGSALPSQKRHFHCWRHTCAVRLLENGAGIEEVQDILGHRDIRNTTIYAKITNKKRMETGERLRKIW